MRGPHCLYDGSIPSRIDLYLSQNTKNIEEACANGLEPNIFELATDLDESKKQIEGRALGVAKTVQQTVSILVAVNLLRFYSTAANFCKTPNALDVTVLVLFNRFCRPDIDFKQLDVLGVDLSNSAELLLRQRWLVILLGRIDASMAATVAYAPLSMAPRR